MDWKSNQAKAGYNIEELYFEKLNRELIKNIRNQHSNTSSTKDPKEKSLAEVIVLRPRGKPQTESTSQKKKAAA